MRVTSRPRPGWHSPGQAGGAGCHGARPEGPGCHVAEAARCSAEGALLCPADQTLSCRGESRSQATAHGNEGTLQRIPLRAAHSSAGQGPASGELFCSSRRRVNGVWVVRPVPLTDHSAKSCSRDNDFSCPHTTLEVNQIEDVTSGASRGEARPFPPFRAGSKEKPIFN